MSTGKSSNVDHPRTPFPGCFADSHTLDDGRDTHCPRSPLNEVDEHLTPSGSNRSSVSIALDAPAALEPESLRGMEIAATLLLLRVTYAYEFEKAIQLGLSATLRVAATVSLVQSTTLTDLLSKLRK
jgi:hypothetical protein